MWHGFLTNCLEWVTIKYKPGWGFSLIFFCNLFRMISKYLNPVVHACITYKNIVLCIKFPVFVEFDSGWVIDCTNVTLNNSKILLSLLLMYQEKWLRNWITKIIRDCQFLQNSSFWWISIFRVYALHDNFLVFFTKILY